MGRTSEMTRQLKAFAARPDDKSVTPMIQTVEKENLLTLYFVLCFSRVLYKAYAPSLTHKINKYKQKSKNEANGLYLYKKRSLEIIDLSIIWKSIYVLP